MTLTILKTTLNLKRSELWNPAQIDPREQMAKHSTKQYYLPYLTFDVYITPRREWADTGSTAIPVQPVGKSEQAPASSPSAKNQFNIDVPRWGTYQILS